MTPEQRSALSRKGALAVNASMTPEQRTARARKAGHARDRAWLESLDSDSADYGYAQSYLAAARRIERGESTMEEELKTAAEDFALLARGILSGLNTPA